MLELVFVRHGEIESNVRQSYVGWTNKELNFTGIQQMEAVGERLADEAFEVIYASPLLRTKESAGYIQKYNNARIVLFDGLKERNFGIFDDLTYEEIQSRYPEETRLWEEDWIRYKIPKGESAKEAYLRNCETVLDIISRHKSGKVCIVTHLGVLRNVISYLLELSIEQSWRFRVDNGGICRIQITDQYAVLTALNA